MRSLFRVVFALGERREDLWLRLPPLAFGCGFSKDSERGTRH